MNSLKIQSNFFIAFHLNNSQNLNLFTGRFDHWADQMCSQTFEKTKNSPLFMKMCLNSKYKNMSL